MAYRRFASQLLRGRTESRKVCLPSLVYTADVGRKKSHQKARFSAEKNTICG